MKNSSYLLLAVTCCVAFTSCKTTKLLEAPFEADAINSPPNKTLPGGPAGDEIIYHDVIVPQLKVQSSTIAGAKALAFTNIDVGNPPGSQRFVRFKAGETDLTKTVWFYYAAKNINASNDVIVDVGDGYGAAIARLRIEGSGKASVVKGSNWLEYEEIGNVGTGVHTVIFTTSLVSKTFNVTIFREGDTALTKEGLPFIEQDATQFKNPARPTIAFTHTGINGSHTYELGFVTISKKKPNNMP